MGTALDQINWILWSGTIGLDSSFEDRIEAAEAGGFTRLSVSPVDIRRAEESGTSAVEVGKQIRGHGIDIVLDPVMNWHPYEGTMTSRFAGIGLGDSMRMSADLEAVAMTVLAMTSSTVPVTDLPELFGRACDLAADHGALVHLEFIPMTVISDLEIAWDIVRAADRANGGLVFDTWHFYRGNPDFEVLAGVPGDKIFAVQIDDALAEVQGTMREDTQRRLLPGDGSFDLVRAIRALDAIGALTWVGPEIINPDMAALPPAEAGRLADSRTRALVQTALEGVPT